MTVQSEHFHIGDKIIYHMREVAAEEGQDGSMILAPMRKATFADYVMAMLQTTLLVIGCVMWIPSILGLFFLFDFTPIHSLIAIANMLAMGFLYDFWGGKKFEKLQKFFG